MCIRKPRICFISESEATYGLLADPCCEAAGGAELQQVLLASALLKLGYKVTFLVADYGQPSKVVTEQGITLIRTRRLFEQRRGLLELADLLRLLRAMSAAGADIYYQRTSAPVTGIAAAYCRLRRRPFVFSVAHDLEVTGSLGLYVDPRYQRLYRYGLRHASVVVVQTQQQLRLLKESTGRDSVLIRSTFSPPDESELRATRQHILWVGSFRAVKHPETFLELAAGLPEHRFVMVGGPGPGEEQLYEVIREKAGPIPNLYLTGPVPHKDVGRYFSEAFAFVNTSSSEGFPNTYLQAWCRGVPVVGTFDPDEVISKYDLGRHCASTDELRAAIRDLMADEEHRKAIGERAVRYVKEHHSADAVTAQYDGLFTRLHRPK